MNDLTKLERDILAELKWSSRPLSLDDINDRIGQECLPFLIDDVCLKLAGEEHPIHRNVSELPVRYEYR
jgi:hypothetical protein